MKVLKQLIKSLNIAPSLIVLVAVFCCFNSYAAEVNLIIWVEEPEDDFSNAFLKKNAVGLKTMIRSQSDLETKFAFFDNGNTDNFKSVLGSALQSSDRIRNLIIATHGETDIYKNESSLIGIGTFNEGGVSGNLESILELLGPKFSQELSISLQACSTLCGDEIAVKKRLRPFFDKIKSFGVKAISLWGSTNDMIHDDDWTALSYEEFSASEEFSGSRRIINQAAPLIGIAFVAMHALLTQSFHTAALGGGLAVSLSTYFGTNALLNYMTGNVGNKGFLVRFIGSEISISPLDSQPRSVILKNQCVDLLR